MDINWGVLDGALGLVLLIVLVWVALKVATRLLIGLAIVALVGVVFLGWHLGGFSGG